MYPIIYKIGPFTIYSFGVMLALAVVVCTFLLSRDMKQALGISSEKVFDFVFWVVMSGIIGARSFFVFLNFNYFLAHPTELIMVQKGGLAWQGSLLAGFVVSVWYIKKHKWPAGPFLDVVAPYIALGQAIGRIGCFLNGCCYGKPFKWGVYFPVHETVLHPTQLYDSLGLFLIFFILKKYQKILKIPGQVFLLYLFLTSTQRFIIEFFRADHEILGALSIFQWICLAIILITWYASTRLQSRRAK